MTNAVTASATWSNTICPDGTNSNSYIDGCFSALDTTPPVVTVTGVGNGHVYVRGNVPAAGCHTTDDTAVAVKARLKVTTAGTKRRRVLHGDVRGRCGPGWKRPRRAGQRVLPHRLRNGRLPISAVR